MNLTDDQLRVAVCKAMGWSVSDSAFCGLPPNETDTLKWEQLPPLTLDLMWQSEEMLSGSELRDYEIFLIQSLSLPLESTPYVGPTFALIHATAVQRARAFLKVKGLL